MAIVQWERLRSAMKLGASTKVSFAEPTDWQIKLMSAIQDVSLSTSRLWVDPAADYMWKLSIASIFTSVCLQLYMTQSATGTDSLGSYLQNFQSSSVDQLWEEQ